MQPALKQKLLRLAVLIHESTKKDEPGVPVRLPHETWELCHSLARRANLARTHAFFAAEQRMRSQLANTLITLIERLNQERELLERNTSSARLVSPIEVYRDLVALFDEFPLVIWCTREHTITVTTETIVLEQVDLGRFEISLNWDSLDRSHCYEVTALDDHPAASDKSIIHPHVQDGSLCEGEGRPLIRQALTEGRLLDFFLIVRSLLSTYNSGGAYVPLDRWYGVNCDGCGELVQESDLVSCNCGNRTVCEYCSINCSLCGECVCDDCSSACSGCDQLCCTRCGKCCDECGVTVCRECLTDGRCKDCVQESEEETEEIEANDEPQSAEVAI